MEGNPPVPLRILGSFYLLGGFSQRAVMFSKVTGFVIYIFHYCDQVSIKRSLTVEKNQEGGGEGRKG